MAGELLDVDHGEPGGSEHPLRREQREVAVVLVVDGVVLVALDEAEQVRDLDAHPALVGDQRAQAVGEVDDVGHVGEHVVRHDQVGRTVGGTDRPARVRAEEVDLRGDTAPDRGGGDVRRRLDPQAPDPPVEHVLQEVAVVAGHLHHQGSLGLQPEPVDGVVDETSRVLHPGVGVGREVGVVVEDLLGRHVGRQLDQQAALAHQHVQRVEGLRSVHLRSGRVRLAQR
ncbi:hypothetical protein GCM10009718_27160 [Isoptericola halotolerans]